MYSLCNVAYVAQAERFTEVDALERWEAELVAEPGAKPTLRRPSYVDPSLLRQVGGPS